MTDSADDVAALQTCLAAEHAAVYAYGVIGGRLAGLSASVDVVERVDESFERHRGQRDALEQSIRDLGAGPDPAQAAYTLPVTPTTVAQCRRLARYLENRCSEAYAYGVALTSPERRGPLATALVGSAVRAATWGGRLEAFPGRADL